MENLMFTEDQYTMHYGRDSSGKEKSRIIRIQDNLNGNHVYIPIHVLLDMVEIYQDWIEE